MHNHAVHRRKFFGVTTIGEKGQIVIPVAARHLLQLQKGEKLLIFGLGENMLAISKSSHLEEFTSKYIEQLEEAPVIVNKSE